METAGWSFIAGCAAYSDFAFVARERDDLMEEGTVATSFYVWDDQNPDINLRWGIYKEIPSWRAMGLGTIKPPSNKRVTVALGSKGQYWEVEPDGLREVAGTIEIEFPIRHVEAIEDVVIACGMGRTARRRESEGVWTEFGPGTTTADQDRIVGFEDIHGLTANELYAVGWHGEIWHWSRGQWFKIDSPTNVNLNAVACVPDGKVYAVGDNGIMIEGTQNLWQIVETNRPENLMDVTSFDNDIFVVTDYRILRLTADGLVPDDRFADGDLPSTCLQLLPAADGVISLGPKDMFSFANGSWRRVI